MQVIPLTAAPQGFGRTSRRDTWWTTPLVVFTVFSSFVVYATWAAFQNAHYEFGPYLSPFYSPVLWGDSSHAWFGPQPAWWPGFSRSHRRLLILPFPGLFRFTCYYYRGAYYKAFWADPPNCAVGEPRKGYLGENSFPLILQNVHRYFFYIAVIFIFILSYDVWLALWFTNPVTLQKEFGIGVGTILLLRQRDSAGQLHVRLPLRTASSSVATWMKCLKSPMKSACYNCATSLNKRHMPFAWMSLFSVAFADIYVRLCSMGIFTDWRIL